MPRQVHRAYEQFNNAGTAALAQNGEAEYQNPICGGSLRPKDIKRADPHNIKSNNPPERERGLHLQSFFAEVSAYAKAPIAQLVEQLICNQ